jgi:hypothetical protein
MTSLVNAALVVDPVAAVDNSLCRASRPRWSHGRLTLRFEGNRVDLTAPAGLGAAVRVLIDGRSPSYFPELYQTERPSDCHYCDVPAVFHVDSQVPKLVENWTLTLSGFSQDVTSWHFKLEGDKTGPDGEGTNTELFVSNSRRVVISPDSWYVHEAFEITKQRPPEGFTVRWKVTPQFIDRLQATDKGTITLAKGLANGPHLLELVADEGYPHPVQIDVYRPPLITH